MTFLFLTLMNESLSNLSMNKLLRHNGVLFQTIKLRPYEVLLFTSYNINMMILKLNCINISNLQLKIIMFK